MSKTILICSSKEFTRDELKKPLTSKYPLIVVENGEQCFVALKQKAPIALAFIGTATEETTLELFKNIRKLAPQLTVIAVGDNGSEDAAVKAVRHGASGYTMLPLRADDILTLAQQSIPA